MTEDDLLRQRLENICEVAGSRVRIKGLEEELHAAKAEIQTLKAELEHYRSARGPWGPMPGTPILTET